MQLICDRLSFVEMGARPSFPFVSQEERQVVVTGGNTGKKKEKKICQYAW